jgi:fibronectin type 3 domain-containing protein
MKRQRTLLLIFFMLLPAAHGQMLQSITNAPVAHEVDLSWTAPVGATDVAGYNIYRAKGGGSFVLVNSSLDTSLTYVDKTVANGTTYSYVVKTVDSIGQESDPSNQITVNIP